MTHRAARRLALFAAIAALTLSAAGAASAAECNGDECQGPAPAPEEVIPATAVVEGPPNPPVRFPGDRDKSNGKRHHAKKHPAKHDSGRGKR
jgi:hypothetical protein